jgi:hypothetical protein
MIELIFEQLMHRSFAKDIIKRYGGSAACLALAAVVLAPLCIAATVAEREVSEYEVKAAYVFYFAKFTEWPAEVLPNPNSPIMIGVIGDNSFASMLENTVKGKTIQNHPILIQNLKMPSDLSGFHMIYVSSYEQQCTNQIAGILQTAPVLTVTEADKNSRSKGLINLLVEEGKIHFEVNLTAVGKTGLKISSKLLRLANALSE